MKSSTGVHYIALDHIRAVAAFLVVAWHFIHTDYNFPIPHEYTPSIFLFPFALLDEGHTGVALFMTLSGYLFAKLLDGRSINYGAFLWNRAIRLLPLLVLVAIAAGVHMGFPGGVRAYLLLLAKGVALPTLPNGGWSITTEFHFYVLLPLLLWLLRRSGLLPLAILAASIALRAWLHQHYGSVQWLAYFTIVGRIDQFVLGMVICRYRAFFAGRHMTALATCTAFALFYWWFDSIGGFYGNGGYPSQTPIWIVMPTIEGLAYAILVAWYDQSFAPRTSGVSGLVGRVGEYSYSIYLLHGFVALRIPGSVDKRIMDLSNFYVACSWALLFYLLMIPVGYLSYRFIESPFLKFRRRYIVDRAPSEAPATSSEIPDFPPPSHDPVPVLHPATTD